MKFRIPPAPHDEVVRAHDAFMSGDEKRANAYRMHYATLDSQTQAYIGYALAVMFHMKESFGLPPYMHFFRKDLPKLHVPFSWIGWAGEHSDIGPAFAIHPECFTGGPITLYYADDDLEAYSPSVREERMSRAKDLAQDIARYSSGITDVHALILPGKHDSILSPQQGPYTARDETCVVAFTLDPAAVKPSVVIQGKALGAEETGGYVFVLPRAGEFNCTMGELFDDHLRLPLRVDSYCMK